ncbi:MAG: hypothetical protein JOZ62_01235 [Acidobacteriaceae bacterium]|nr:hypothetical protein [Acidobacteriaceae bacterium]
MSELDALIAHIREIWPDLTVLLPKSDDRYQSLPLCIIDAVYSIGVRYESTERTVDNFCKWTNWNYEQEYTVNEFIALFADFDGDWERLATEVFRNRQRTSSRSGILKADAVYRFARGLQSCDVNTRADIPEEVTFDPPDRLVSAITAIPGQSSGISLKYFLMLAGYDGAIKPDRMVVRFVADALGRNDVTPDVAETLVLSTHKVLRSEMPDLTAAILDYGIWSYQRGRSGKKDPKPIIHEIMRREVVLRIGGEGGSLTLVRQRTADEQWQFRIETNETALYDMLSDEDRNGIEFSSQTGYVRSFEQALELLDRYPWFDLYPIEVHPAFVEAVLREVRKRGGGAVELRWREELNRKLNNR